ncbi:MAG: protein-L-isoaspartate(D-aspartate) O-methyltransferase, partial [Chloroflexota bacterium]
RTKLLDYLSREIKDRSVVEAMRRVRREVFVLPECLEQAYEDIPLSIGFGQTISQPLIVGLMTQALELTGSEIVLEVGTGSGYQTAVLAELARKVVTVDRLPALVEQAGERLARLGYTNIEIHLAGEKLGWSTGAPYGAIVVTAGAPDVPRVLLEQLASGGRLVIPVGDRRQQELLQVTRQRRGKMVKYLGGCRFVPLIGPGAWPD